MRVVRRSPRIRKMRENASQQISLSQRQSAMQRQRSQRQRHNASLPAETATQRRGNTQSRRRIPRPEHRVVPRMRLATTVPPTPPAGPRMDSARIRARLFHAHLNELHDQSEIQESRARMLYNDYSHVMRDSSSYLHRLTLPSNQIEPAATATLPSPLQIGTTVRNDSLRLGANRRTINHDHDQYRDFISRVRNNVQPRDIRRENVQRRERELSLRRERERVTGPAENAPIWPRRPIGPLSALPLPDVFHHASNDPMAALPTPRVAQGPMISLSRVPRLPSSASVIDITDERDEVDVQEVDIFWRDIFVDNSFFGLERNIGLNEQQILDIPKKIYRRLRSSRHDTCHICLVDFENSDQLSRLTKCGHEFHPSCLKPWLHRHTTCPVCRQSVLA